MLIRRESMNIAFCGLRHDHIFWLYKLASENPEIRITGAWEEDPAALEKAKLKMNVTFYESYEMLLENSNADIIAVGDYYGIRGRRVIQALKAGKHVLCDKPICTHLSELDEIETICQKNNLYIGCMLDLRYDPAVRFAAKTVRRGELGEIHAINFTGQHPLMYGIRPMWYFEEGKHGGTLNDLAIHGLDAVTVITGLRYRRTTGVRQYNAFAREQKKFCDCAQFMAEYENGAGLIADVSYSAPDSAFSLPGYWRFSFWGEKGMLECRLGEKSILMAQNGRPAERITVPAVSDEDCLRDLLHAVRGEAYAFTPNDALISSRYALMLQRDADTEREKRK